MGLSLTTLEEIRDYTGIASGQIADDVLGRMAEAAEKFIGRKCNRPDGFVTATHTEVVNGRGVDYVYVLNSPITSITSIKTIDTSSTKTTIDATLYTFETDYSGKISAIHPSPNSHVGRFEAGLPIETSRRVRQGLFPDGLHRKNIEVIYVGGYAETAGVPEDLSQAVISLTKMLADAIEIDDNLASETLGAHAWAARAMSEFDNGLPPFIASMIQPYVRMAR